MQEMMEFYVKKRDFQWQYSCIIPLALLLIVSIGCEKDVENENGELSPKVGEVVELPSFDKGTTFTLPFENGEQEYLLILYSLGEKTTEKIDYDIA